MEGDDFYTDEDFSHQGKNFWTVCSRHYFWMNVTVDNICYGETWDDSLMFCRHSKHIRCWPNWCHPKGNGWLECSLWTVPSPGVPSSATTPGWREVVRLWSFHHSSIAPSHCCPLPLWWHQSKTHKCHGWRTGLAPCWRTRAIPSSSFCHSSPKAEQ